MEVRRTSENFPRTSVNGTNGVCVGSVHLLTFTDIFRLPPEKPEIHKLGSPRPSTGCSAYLSGALRTWSRLGKRLMRLRIFGRRRSTLWALARRRNLDPLPSNRSHV